MRKEYVKKNAKVEIKAALIGAYESGGDWKSLAENKGISLRTAYRWLDSSTDIPDTRGGKKKKRLSDEHLDFITGLVNSNPRITVKDIKFELCNKFENLSVCEETVRKALDECLFTLKDIRFEPENANSMTNRLKRKTYVETLLNFIGSHVPIIFMDESNFNLHISRSQGRAPRGERCSVRAAATKGANVHLIGSIGITGPLNFKIKRGSFKKPDVKIYVEETLIMANNQYNQPVVLVIDNAPAHNNIENEISSEILGENKILRLGPYSPMLNPIERVWSVIKAVVKQKMANSDYFNEDTNGLSTMEFRLKLIEDMIKESIEIISPEMCNRFISSVQSLFSDVIQLKDVQF